VISEPVVANVKNPQNTGDFSRQKDRPGPPDLFGEIHDGFGATEDFTFTGNDAHLAQQLIGRQREKGCHAGVLQCREAKTALLECAAESPRQ